MVCCIYFTRSFAPFPQEDPCLRYTLVSDSWRNKDFNSSTLAEYKCDSTLSKKWLRFVGIAGDIMVQSSVPEYRSGTQCSIYLNFTHPDTVYETLTGSAYCQWEGNAQYVHFIDVMEMACSGGFYVYKVQDLPCEPGLKTGISLSEYPSLRLSDPELGWSG